ncbi:cache domain-containing protein, partial [Campylobacter sp. 9BO]|uniref:sensor histidine kinase n=1 Tax=Campylobacter sp. 9BO TaxID=3424759 RepID=UPI003D334E94
VVIILASLLFLVFGVKFYHEVKTQLVNLSDVNKITTAQNIVKSFDARINERTNALSVISKIIENSYLLDDENELNSILKTMLVVSKNFDMVQILKNDGEIYVNGERYKDESVVPKSERTNLLWYIQTIQTNAPTINYMPNHTILKVPTINICVPNHKNSDVVAVLCGVVKLEDIFTNIKNFELAQNVYAFLLTHNGEILTKMDNEDTKNKIEYRTKEMFLNQSDVSGFTIDSSFISLSEIPDLNWYIGVGASESRQMSEILAFAQKNSLTLLSAFILLILFANFLHNYMHKRLRDKNEEYEILLKHKAKMAETGELIAGINHQFIQPVNSLNIMISSLLMLEQEGNLDKTMLREILRSGEGSVKMLKDTIEIFRNFYKTSENIDSFSLKQSIKNLLMLMHTELSRANVSVVVTEFDDVLLRQKENIIQQILLILIHNAKDAVVERYADDITKRQIILDAKIDEMQCRICVIESGIGVSKDMVDKIFNAPKTTKKTGNGIGLYFGKKLANEKINGDIALKQMANPTIFELTFQRNLEI